jgi:hypothetical protein
MLRGQVEVGNHLADLGVPLIQRSEFVAHGDKGFQIKPWVAIPEKFSRADLDKVQRAVLAMHAAGYVLRDRVQVGLDAAGEPVMFDVGKAAPIPAAGQSRKWALDDDMGHVERLYMDSGVPFARLDGQPQAAWAALTGRFAEATPSTVGFMAYQLSALAAQRRKGLPAEDDGSRLIVDEEHVEALRKLAAVHPLPRKEVERVRGVVDPVFSEDLDKLPVAAGT